MEDLEELPEEPWWKRPLVILGALFLVILFLGWLIPQYAIKLDPEPENIPSWAAIAPDVPSHYPASSSQLSQETLINFVRPDDPYIKQLATRIATASCDGERVCYAKALYYYVRDNLKYVNDPVNQEYVEAPEELLRNQGGDCESGSLLLASLFEAIGIDAQLVFISGHAYIRIKLPEAINRYQNNDWVYLDWTCKHCGFGELPPKSWQAKHTFLDV